MEAGQKPPHVLVIAAPGGGPRLLDTLLQLADAGGVLAVLSPRARLVLGTPSRELVLEASTGRYGLPVLIASLGHACTAVIPVGGDQYEALLGLYGTYDTRRLGLTAGTRRRGAQLCRLVARAIERMCAMGASPVRAAANVAWSSPSSLTLLAWLRRGLEAIVAAGSERGAAISHNGGWLHVSQGGEGMVAVVEAREGVVRVKKLVGVEEARRL